MILIFLSLLLWLQSSLSASLRCSICTFGRFNNAFWTLCHILSVFGRLDFLANLVILRFWTVWNLDSDQIKTSKKASKKISKPSNSVFWADLADLDSANMPNVFCTMYNVPCILCNVQQFTMYFYNVQCTMYFVYFLSCLCISCFFAFCTSSVTNMSAEKKKYLFMSENSKFLN